MHCIVGFGLKKVCPIYSSIASNKWLTKPRSKSNKNMTTVGFLPNKMSTQPTGVSTFGHTWLDKKGKPVKDQRNDKVGK